MKKFFSLLAAAFMAVGLFAEPVTVTFKDWGLAPNNTNGDNNTAYTTANIKDSIEGAAFIDTFTVATKVYAARVNMGAKFGSSKATGKIQFVLATPAEFDSIVFSAASYSTSEGSVSICGGEAIDLTNGGTLNKIMQNLVYRPTGVVDTISFETTLMRAYLKSITFYPKANTGEGGDTPGEGGETAAITYELNGGVANDYGWTTPGDMFAAFMAESGATDFETLEYYKAQADPLGSPNICAKLNNPETCFKDTAKWGWLMTYIMGVHAAQAGDGASALTAAGSGSAWRYAVGAFFIDGQRAGWPKSANFATCGAGTLATYQPLWKCAYANPTNPTDSFVLNEPYKEEWTFDGWYATADFSGDKVTTVDENTTGTLYAKWIMYVPTIAEVKALADSTETKVTGVVTFINENKVYIQDATGGMLLYMSATPSFNVGDKVIVNGLKVMYDGAPEITEITVLSTEASTVPAAAKFETLKAACKDANLFTRVSLNGLKIVALDNYNNPSVTDGVDTVLCYKMAVDSTFTIGAKVNITAILATYQGDYQFVGDAAGIELAPLGVKDTYAYPARSNGEYTLANKWVFSNVEDNFAANKPGASAGDVRGMAAKNGIMYFINRPRKAIIPVDAATATMLDPIKITGEHLFEALDTTDNSYKSAVTLAYNDIKFDGAGNCLIGACISGSQHFMIYKVDLATGAATLLIDEKLVDNNEFATIAADSSRTWGGRFDAFGVYGDVNSDAIVMAVDANSFYVYKWTITNGVAGAAEQIDCVPDVASDQSYLITDGALNVTNFGTAPQVFPVDDNYFYIDGWSTLPMLYDMDGTLAEDFITCPTGVAVVNNPGDTCKMNTGHNGICEFQVGNDYFMVMAATNTATTPSSAFALYKFADKAKSFSGLEPLWYFPANGMGKASNGYRTAVPSVEVDGNKATIYLYAGDNGYGVYEFTSTASSEPDPGSAIENTEANNVTKIIENGQVYIIKNGVRYTVLGVVVE